MRSEQEAVEVIASEERLGRLNRGLKLLGHLPGWLWSLNYRRYEKHVPAEIREMAERNGVPKPNRYVPAAANYPSEIPDDSDWLREKGLGDRA